MATATLVGQFKNHLRYLITKGNGGTPTDTSVTIPCSGGPSPDLITDSLAGPIKTIAKVVTQGLGNIPPGAVTQDQARAMWFSDGSTNIGGPAVPRAVCRLTTLTGATAPQVDADQVAGSPVVVVRISDAGIASCYLDIQVFGTIGS